MKYFISIFSLLIVLASCRNSPSSYAVGKFDGNYHVDSVASGTASANVIEVNSLTVHISMDLQNHPDFQMNNVEINGQGDIYTLTYNGTEGEMNGSVDHDHMSFILLADEDTVYFQGNR